MSKISPSEKLRRIIAKCAINELVKVKICNLPGKQILSYVLNISEFIFRKVKLQYSDKSEEYLKNLIYCIVQFLTKIKPFYETDQLINVSEVATKTHNKELFSLSTWETYTWNLINYLREDLGFNIRTKRHNPHSESKRHSIWSYKILYDLINNRTFCYLDIDYETEIAIRYEGRCQGIDGYCSFHIDYKFLPALSFDHLLKDYRRLVKRDGYEYIKPNTLVKYSLNKAIKKMQTQIGGLKLVCKNCHYMGHHPRYRFPAIFEFIRSLSLKNIEEDPTNVLDTADELAKKYLKNNRGRFRITKTNPIPTIKYNIKINILKHVKKKYCIEFLFGENYVCPICEKVDINKHLDLFVAHHTNLELIRRIGKIEFSKEFDRKPIDWLIENLIQQECIFICHNCHTIDFAKNYRDSVLAILKNMEDSQYVLDFYKNSDRKIGNLKKIILKWKDQLLNGNLNIPDPFPKKPDSIFESGEAIDKRLVCIYYICKVFSKQIEKNFFWGIELSYILNRNVSDFYDFKNRLINHGFIQYKGRLVNWKDTRINKDVYQITEDGIQKAKKIIKIKQKDYSTKFDKLVSNWFTKYDEYFNERRIL